MMTERVFVSKQQGEKIRVNGLYFIFKTAKLEILSQTDFTKEQKIWHIMYIYICKFFNNKTGTNLHLSVSCAKTQFTEIFLQNTINLKQSKEQRVIMYVHMMDK